MNYFPENIGNQEVRSHVPGRSCAIIYNTRARGILRACRPVCILPRVPGRIGENQVFSGKYRETSYELTCTRVPGRMGEIQLGIVTYYLLPFRHAIYKIEGC